MIELDQRLIERTREGEPMCISGSGAAALGLLEGMVRVAVGYPGAPCTEILENLKPFQKARKIYAEWPANEKVALEIATGAAISGVRAVFIAKNLGINAAADVLFHIPYGELKGGMLIISADDPRGLNTTIIEDTRFYAKAVGLPGLEPADPAELREMVREGFRISEDMKIPVFIRVSGSVLHSRGRLIKRSLPPVEEKSVVLSVKDLSWVIAGINTAIGKKRLEKKQLLLSALAGKSRFNLSDSVKSEFGIITTGSGCGLVSETLTALNAEKSIPVLRLGWFHPLPEKIVRKFIADKKKILIVEEVSSYLEEEVKRLSAGDVTILGLPEKTEAMDARQIETNLLKAGIVKGRGAGFKIDFFKRPQLRSDRSQKQIEFCPGCPHRASFYNLRKTVDLCGGRVVTVGDSGCYILGVRPPFRSIDLALCMGSSIGIAIGIGLVQQEQKVIAVMGDSTFFHSGINALISACSNRRDLLLYILDNRRVALTGGQLNPGSGGGGGKEIVIEDLARSCGADQVHVIDPFQPDVAKDTLALAIKGRGVRVVISRSPCLIFESGNVRKKMRIDPQACQGCGRCLEKLACPALKLATNGKMEINSQLCVGCGLCAWVCPQGAIIDDTDKS